MAHDETTPRETNIERKIQRDNIARNGLGATRPQRRIVEGHTSPCAECGVLQWKNDTSRGEVSCGGCGIVVEENTPDPGAEWTNHDNTNDRSRVGAPSTFTLADKGLNTSIASSDLTSGGAGRYGLSAKARRDWRRRRTIDERSKTRENGKRNLVKANQTIRDKSGLPKPMKEEACRLYKLLSEKGFVTGRSIAGVTAACTYLIARNEGVPRQISDIAEIFEVGEKELSRMIRKIARDYNLHKLTSPSEYFGRYISDLKLPPNTQLQVDHLWSVLEPHDQIWQGKRPNGVAAALIYKAASESGHKRTQAEICAVAKISEVTLRGMLRLFEGLFKSAGESSHN
ncbi:MAG: transcription initiation factor IIB family protein [Euryarchaeota archaeon]|jgi:transcription initiation factor TFIIB|nr:transcription initiation factor IIB family protein [Euryarchaeota archaeon]MBT5184166.1 transcription initiation factor IIB family protein [Euryarchaeota archaeon]